MTGRSIVLVIVLTLSVCMIPGGNDCFSQMNTSSSGTTSTADSPWPMFRQNLNHTGLSPYDTTGNPGKLRWSFTTGDNVLSSPAIGSDGTIYVDSWDTKLYAINPDGTEKWNFTTGGGDYMHSSPAIGSDGTVYVGSWDDRLYAINPDGTEKWSFPTGGHVDSSPAIGSDGIVYVGSDDHQLYAINPDGTEKWSFPTGDRIHSSPAIGSDGIVYVGSWDTKLYAINPDGTEKWSFPTGDRIFSSPAIGSDGTVYVGSHDYQLYAINPDGTEKWSFPTGGHVFSSPAIGSDGTIYVGSYDNKLYAINPDGTEKWNFTSGSNVHSSPAIGSDGTIYVGSWDNRLYAIGIPRNQPPVADANGPYYVGEGWPITLDGSGSSDPDNDTLQYRWDLDNDGVWDTSWSYDPTTVNTWNDDGTYIVAVRVKDSGSEADVDYATVYVSDFAPVAEFDWSPEPQNEGSPVQFTDMSISYPDAVTSWHWKFGDGGISTDQNATHTYGDNGIYTVTLTVTDDDGSTDAVNQSVTILNVAPIAQAGGDREGFEVSTFTFDGSCTDPGILDTHTYEWDFDYDGATFDADASGQSTTRTWIEDFNGTVALRVTDDDGGVGLDTAHVLVKNVPPTVKLTVLPVNVNVSLRIAGEKWHDVSIELYESGILVAQGNLVRYPGSPNDQILDLTYLSVNISRKYSSIVRYTPEDDPINGQPMGADPCWIILTFDGGEELRLHHNFNVNHPERYVWEVDLVATILSHGLTFEATAFDPGADSLIFFWSFGDGTNSTSFYPNANSTYPVQITETITHAFLSSGSFTVTLTVTDDDGGVGVATVNIVIP